VAKKKERRAPKAQPKKELTMNPWIMHVLSVVVFLIISVAYFYPQLEGKVIPQSDIVNYTAASHELKTYADQDGTYPLWTNSMFGGMPAYQIASPTPGNRTSIVEKAFNLFMGRPIGYFVAMMIGFYIMCITFGMRPLVALVGSIAFGLTVNHFVLFEAGHTSKLRAFAFFGIIVAGIANAYRGKYLLGGLLFALGMALEIGVNHIQMPYYLFMTLLVYVGFLLYRDIQAGNISNFIRASLVLLVALFLGVAANTSRLWTTSQYAQDTMRGKPILTKNNINEASSSEVEGLAWDYAMQWSNGTLDLFTYLVPGIVGGGSREPVGSDSEFAQITGQTNAKNIMAPLYWGSLPFTSGPSYVGAIVLFLFVLGSICIRGDMRWWLVSTTILTLLLSLGSNFEILNRLFFDYFPMYNKFRTPNSIASITEFLMVLMATWTLSEIINGSVGKDKLNRSILIAGGVTGGLCLLIAVLGPSLFAFSGASDGNYDPRIVTALASDRQDLMQMDAMRSLVLIVLGAGLLMFYSRGKVSSMVLLVSLAALTTFDLWGVARRYVNTDSFVRPNQSQAALAPREVDKLIEKDTDIHFRVHDLSVNTFNSAIPAYHHKMIGGYHAAKLQRYQDLIDYYIQKNHFPVLNMLNAKYIIDQQGQLQVNTQAFGNAWFVSQINEVESANAEIEALESTDLANVAVVNKEFEDYLGTKSFSVSGTIELESYHPDRLVYTTSGNTEQFAVFSEIWYGPDKGWNAYIDDAPAEFIRVNYALRGMKIPPGKHTIRFEFRPQAFYTGEVISNISSIFILLLVALYIFHQFRPFPFITKLEQRNQIG